MRRVILALTVGLALVLTGCTGTSAPVPSQPPVSQTPTTPEPTPADEGPGLLTVSAHGVQLQAGDPASFDDPLAVLGLMTDLIGVQPTISIDATAGLVTHAWDGARILERDNRVTLLSVSASELGGMPVVAAGGVGVGMSRADALAAGAVEGVDGTLVIDARDGASVTLRLDGDTISELLAPANVG